MGESVIRDSSRPLHIKLPALLLAALKREARRTGRSRDKQAQLLVSAAIQAAKNLENSGIRPSPSNMRIGQRKTGDLHYPISAEALGYIEAVADRECLSRDELVRQFIGVGLEAATSMRPCYTLESIAQRIEEKYIPVPVEW